MGALVRTVGYGDADAPIGKRVTHTLADGSCVAIIADVNQAGVTGDGGDNTGVAKFYIYYSVDRTTWTLKTTLTPTSAPLSPAITYSSAVGANNNIHLAFRSTDGAVRYYLFNYSSSGPTWTSAGQETVMGAAVSPAIPGSTQRIDMDVIGSANNVVIAVYFATFVTSPKLELKTFIRNDTPAWVAQTPVNFVNGTAYYSETPDITVSADAGGRDPATNLVYYAVVVTRKASTGTDYGDNLYMFRTNLSTGVQSSQVLLQQAFNTGLGSGYRKYLLFSSAAGEWTLIGAMSPNALRLCVYRFRYVNGVLTNHIPLQTALISSPPVMVRTPDVNHWTTVSYADDRALVYMHSTTYTYAVSLRFTRTPSHAVVYGGRLSLWEDQYRYNAGGTLVAGHLPMAGGNRNISISLRKYDVIWYYSVNGAANAYRLEATRPLPELAPANVVPATSAVVDTDRPILSSDFRRPYNFAAISAKMIWQVATDAAFSTNVRTITETDTDLVYADGTKSTTPIKVTASELVTSLSELYQGVWYIRSAQINELGIQGPYSGGHSFTITHLPVASNLYPDNDAIFDYATAGTVSFTWTFTDPSPYDFQTAYQVVVQDADTATVLLDTGKSLSSVGRSVRTIPETGKDIQLRWRVRLWDSDDVVGPYSTWATFYAADRPGVVVTSPADGTIISTGNPAVAWTFTVGGSRVQKAFKVVIAEGFNSRYDSGWINGSNTTHIVPTGKLSNNTFYIVTVYVRDDFGLEDDDSAAFSTSWTPPTSPTLTISSTSYAASGYNLVSWTDAAVDADFVAWRIYRRIAGETFWTMIYETTENLSAYSYQDWLAGSGVSYEYAGTQVVDRFGSIIESQLVATSQVVGYSDVYWLIHPTDTSRNMILYWVVEDSFSEEYESNTYNVIGRGRHTDYGDRLGFVGSLTVHFRDRAGNTARELRLQLEDLKAERRDLYLRNPFGDVWLVQFDDISINRIPGVSRNEFVDVTIPYKQVSF